MKSGAVSNLAKLQSAPGDVFKSAVQTAKAVKNEVKQVMTKDPKMTIAAAGLALSVLPPFKKAGLAIGSVVALSYLAPPEQT